MRQLCTLFIASFAMIAATLGANAQQGGLPKFETKADFAILLDADSNAVLFEKNADEVMHPASMSKLMTMVMVFEAIQRGDMTLEEKFFISENAWREGGEQ